MTTQRVNLSIPSDVVASVQRLRARGLAFNMSKVATAALQREIQRLEGKPVPRRRMVAAAERLRASMKARGHAAHTQGFQAGRAWALDEATHDEITRMSAQRDATTGELAGGFLAIARGLADALEPNHYTRGFVEGACGVWDALASEVEG